MKVDVVMWTKNGERTLSKVLEGIERAIPAEFVHRKIMVDDHSKDKTVEIARDLGWEVYPNPGGGIPSGANEALRHVDCDYFISVEQDVVLAEDWFEKVYPLIQEEKVAVASGIRLPDKPEGLRKLHEYVSERYMANPEKYVRSAFLGISLDNTIYKTRIMKALGGFPMLPVSGGVVVALARNVFSSGYLWKVNPSAVSTHLRTGLLEEMRHWYFYGECSKYLKGISDSRSLLRILLIAGFSPIRALAVAWKKRCPSILYIYPAIRFSMLLGALRARL
jgi:glycosyltransferase involved in cell wall biosynthesis